jgi:hypothetical protein
MVNADHHNTIRVRAICAEAVSEPSARNFEHGVSERERAEYPAFLIRSEFELGGHPRHRRRNAQSIEISDDGQRKNQAEQRAPRVSGFVFHMRHAIRHMSYRMSHVESIKCGADYKKAA